MIFVGAWNNFKTIFVAQPFHYRNDLNINSTAYPSFNLVTIFQKQYSDTILIICRDINNSLKINQPSAKEKLRINLFLFGTGFQVSIIIMWWGPSPIIRYPRPSIVLCMYIFIIGNIGRVWQTLWGSLGWLLWYSLSTVNEDARDKVLPKTLFWLTQVFHIYMIFRFVYCLCIFFSMQKNMISIIIIIIIISIYFIFHNIK